MKKTYLLICLLALATISFADVNKYGSTVEWNYIGNTGPSWWAKLNPNFSLCALGKTQSPINIPRQTIPTQNKINFDYSPVQLVLVYDGLTNLTINKTQIIFNDGHTIQINLPPTAGKLTFAGNDYSLIQIHFHTPSETQIRSRATPLEAHFVHQATNGQVVVVAVLIEAGETNPEIKKIVSHLPSDRGVIHQIEGETIDANGLLPEKKNYYSFMGSLTTPPCSEGLQWIVMATPVTASPSQILQLRNIIGNNARPIQKLFGRTISYLGE